MCFCVYIRPTCSRCGPQDRCRFLSKVPFMPTCISNAHEKLFISKPFLFRYCVVVPMHLQHPTTTIPAVYRRAPAPMSCPHTTLQMTYRLVIRCHPDHNTQIFLLAMYGILISLIQSFNLDVKRADTKFNLENARWVPASLVALFHVVGLHRPLLHRTIRPCKVSIWCWCGYMITRHLVEENSLPLLCPCPGKEPYIRGGD